MKKKVIVSVALLFVIILIIFAIHSSQSNKNDKSLKYGQYRFDEIVYLSPLSSYTEEYLVEIFKNVEILVTESVFEISKNDSAIGHVLIKNPTYEKKIADEYRRVIKNTVASYSIIDEYNSEQNQIIILTDNDNELIITSFYNNGEVADAISFYRKVEQ